MFSGQRTSVLTPSTLLVGAEDTVKLTGFEVARLGRASLNTGGLTERADIQAVGLLLMHMLTGEAPPRSRRMPARTPSGRSVPQVSAAVRELVMEALVSVAGATSP